MSLEARVERARRLLASVEKNHSPSVLASSFGAEDMVVLDLIARDADAYAANRATGSFILIDDATHHTVAGGMIAGIVI